MIMIMIIIIIIIIIIWDMLIIISQSIPTCVWGGRYLM